VNASVLDPPDPTDAVWVFPSQLLTVEVLQRPVESTLATLVRVEHHPRRGITGGDRVGQRVAGQLGAQMLGQGEADHPAGGDVDHGGQVQPALPGRDVGDVATPAGVDRGGVDGEVPADQVGSGGRRRVRDRGLVPAARRPAPQPGAAHQPGHPLTAVVVAGAAQRGVDAWCAIAALGHLVRLADLLGQRGVGDLPGRWGAGSLGVVGGTGDL
jgi:hypothetical protein